MKFRFVAALNRVRLRRKLQLERARLAEMETNAALLIAAQARRVSDLETCIGDSHTVARRVERRAKAGLLAAA